MSQIGPTTPVVSALGPDEELERRIVGQGQEVQLSVEVLSLTAERFSQ
jgi:hypothetical protein